MLVLLLVSTFILLLSQVFCQSVKAVNVEIEGELKGTADFKWEVDRGRTEMVLLALTLNPGTMANLLASLFRGTGKSPRPVDEENVDRLNATIVGVANQDLKVTYRLTLKDLQFSDKNSAFFLRALFESSISGSTVNSGAAVTLITVHGSFIKRQTSDTSSDNE